jgi:hypothetical protein
VALLLLMDDGREGAKAGRQAGRLDLVRRLAFPPCAAGEHKGPTGA